MGIYHDCAGQCGTRTPSFRMRRQEALVDTTMPISAVRFLRLSVCLAVLLAACGAPASSPSPTDAPATAAATEPPAPTAADTAASATAAPAVDATATAPAAATATSASSNTPALQAINPLTGQPVADPAVLDRRPLAIKVAHFPRAVRTFQVGLSQADHVWEHYAEGGTVRFTAVFLSQTPERVGNVRSARLIDAYLGQAYQAMLVASGSSTGTMQRLRETDFYDRVISEYTGYGGCPLLCREESAAVTSNKLFTSPPALWELAETLGLGGAQDLSGFVFDEAPPAGGVPASTIHIDWLLNYTITEWRYDAATGLYGRWIDTDATSAAGANLAPHVDTANGQALTAADVVVLVVPHISSNIHEEEGGQVYYSYDIPLYGSGPARLFRDGLMYEATWTRDEEAGGLPRLVDAGGNVMALRPGVVWFDVLSDRTRVSFEDGVLTAWVRVPGASAPGATATP